MSARPLPSTHKKPLLLFDINGTTAHRTKVDKLDETIVFGIGERYASRVSFTKTLDVLWAPRYGLREALLYAAVRGALVFYTSMQKHNAQHAVDVVCTGALLLGQEYNELDKDETEVRGYPAYKRSIPKLCEGLAEFGINAESRDLVFVDNEERKIPPGESAIIVPTFDLDADNGSETENIEKLSSFLCGVADGRIVLSKGSRVYWRKSE